MRAAHTAVLRETDSAVRKKVAGFNLTDRGLNELTEFSTLIFVDGSFQILNFRCTFADKDNQGNV